MTATHYRIYRQSGWVKFDTPQEYKDKELILQALKQNMNTDQPIDLITDGQPPATPETYYRCSNCGKHYIAFNSVQPGQHLQPVSEVPDGAEIVECYPKCCFEVCPECNEMIKKQ